MTKKRSYSGVVSDLHCANDEAKGYLDEVIRLRKEVFDLNIYKQEYDFLHNILKYIISGK